MSVDCSTQPKKILNDKLVFHLKILHNIILKVLPYLDDGFKGTGSSNNADY
jgi:hypothetical protein